jgi:uncharacterized protein YqjF (DUF2071 family)
MTDETGSPNYGRGCPADVKRASMIDRGDLRTFLHWSYDPGVVQRLLPPGLTVDTYDELVLAAGLPHPEGDPIAHWSPGIEVRIGFPHSL